MPDINQVCFLTLTTDFELVESEDGKSDFVAVRILADGEELETVIMPVEEE